MCLEIHELDPAKFHSAPGLAWQAALKKTDEQLELLTYTDMLLMVEKSIRGGICHPIYRYGKANNKFLKNYDKNKESSSLQYWDANDLYGRKMSQKLQVKSLECIKDNSQFNEDFIKKSIMKNVGYLEGYMEDIFLKLIFNILINYMNFIIVYHFYLRE